MIPDFWDERYAEDEFAYGKKPNSFLKETLSDLKRGTILFPCEGEGRNAVYTSEQAWTVYAFDYSEQGRQKAMTLATERLVNFQYDIFDVEHYKYNFLFDAVGLFFTHFPIEFQVAYYTKFIDSLKEGGTLLGELFSVKQLTYQNKFNSGGPKNIDMLMSIVKMKSLFPAIEFQILGENEVVLDEGPYHQGKAHTIRFKGIKKSKESDLTAD